MERSSRTFVSQLIVWIRLRANFSWWVIEPIAQILLQEGWYSWELLQKLADRKRLEKLCAYSSRWEVLSERQQDLFLVHLEELCQLLVPLKEQEVVSLKKEKTVTTFIDKEYPDRLRTIDEPPPVLWGNSALENSWWERSLAVVGSRRSSQYGEQAAELIVHDLVQKYGFTIVSGCAVGIDSAAHHAALRAGGRTAGILGTDFAHTPHRIKNLFGAKNSLLLSEWSPSEGGEKWNFARRNRLIAGLAQAVLVIEAQEKSGTMITVSAALDQGKDVFVIPHSISSKNAGGVSQLANRGAIVVLSADQIAESLGVPAVGITQLASESDFNSEEKMIIQYLQEHNNEALFPEILGLKPVTTNSSDWWWAIEDLTQKRIVQQVMGVMALQTVLSF